MERKIASGRGQAPSATTRASAPKASTASRKHSRTDSASISGGSPTPLLPKITSVPAGSLRLNKPRGNPADLAGGGNLVRVSAHSVIACTARQRQFPRFDPAQPLHEAALDLAAVDAFVSDSPTSVQQIAAQQGVEAGVAADFDFATPRRSDSSRTDVRGRSRDPSSAPACGSSPWPTRRRASDRPRHHFLEAQRLVRLRTQRTMSRRTRCRPCSPPSPLRRHRRQPRQQRLAGIFTACP